MAIQWETLLAAIGGVGALGVAAYGVVEAFGKAVAGGSGLDGRPWGLPYRGFGQVRRLAVELGPAMTLAYGDDYLQLLAQQYRDGRGKGRAPDTLKQGVRLALPFMSVPDAKALIDKVWGLGGSPALGGVAPSEALARALVDEKAVRFGGGAPDPQAEAAANEAAATLAGRFSLALDTRIDAAFTIAEQRYQATAKISAGAMAVLLAIGFDLAYPSGIPWPVAILIGLVAVPLAPVANDLVSSLSAAAKAWQSISRAKT